MSKVEIVTFCQYFDDESVVAYLRGELTARELLEGRKPEEHLVDVIPGSPGILVKTDSKGLKIKCFHGGLLTVKWEYMKLTLK